MVIRRIRSSLPTALAVFLLALVLGAVPGLGRETISLEDGTLLRVTSRHYNDRPVVLHEGRLDLSGLFFEVIEEESGQVLSQGWVPGTMDSVPDVDPTIGFETWTRQGVIAWSRGEEGRQDIYIIRYNREEGVWSLPVRLVASPRESDQRNPALVVDEIAGIHVVWWDEEHEEDGTVLYQRFHILNELPLAEEPESLEVEVSDDEGSARFPYMAYQESSSTIYLVVQSSEDELDVYRFSSRDAEGPTGGGSIVMPVSILSRLGEEQEVQPLVTFAGEEEEAVVYWVEGEYLHYFVLDEEGVASPMRLYHLTVQYDDLALEELVQSLVLSGGEGPRRPGFEGVKHSIEGRLR